MASYSKSLYFIFKLGDDGRMEMGPRTRRRFTDELQSNFKVGDRLVITVKKARKEKSMELLGYYYGVILPYATYALINAGNRFSLDSEADMDEVDLFLKRRFLKNGAEIVDENGVLHTGKPSLAIASTQEALDFGNDVIVWLAEAFGQEVPLPDKEWETSAKEFLKKELDKKYAT